MDRRHKKPPQKRKLPKIWLMTDERLGKRLLPAIRRMPAGSGVIFRHYDLAEGARHKLFREVRRLCRRRGHKLFLAGDERSALEWHADGFHDRQGARARSGLPRSASVHNITELRAAQRIGADLLFISPLFSTRSHPGARPLGMTAFARLAALRGGADVIALGGMTRARGNMLDQRIVHGWAAIDAFI